MLFCCAGFNFNRASRHLHGLLLIPSSAPDPRPTYPPESGGIATRSAQSWRVSWSRHVPGHQATDCLALPGALVSPAHPNDTPCCGVRNILLPAGSNAVNPPTHRTCEHNNFLFPSVLVPPTGRMIDPCTLSMFSVSRTSCVSQLCRFV